MVTFRRVRRSALLLELLLEQTLSMEMLTWLPTSITMQIICGGMCHLLDYETFKETAIVLARPIECPIQDLPFW